MIVKSASARFAINATTAASSAMIPAVASAASHCGMNVSSPYINDSVRNPSKNSPSTAATAPYVAARRTADMLSAISACASCRSFEASSNRPSVIAPTVDPMDRMSSRIEDEEALPLPSAPAFDAVSRPELLTAIGAP